MLQTNIQDLNFMSDRTVMETTIWSFINDNIRRTHENELGWIQDLRRAISNIANENDEAENANIIETVKKEKSDGIMKYTVNNNYGISYVYFNDSETKLETESNILEIITALTENNTQFVLFDSEALSKDFLELKNRLVGTMLQKFTMYHIKSAIVFKDMNSLKVGFKDSIYESGKHDVLMLFTNAAEAEKWFLNIKKEEF